ncbi:3841_t:CDS:2, partial [Dentiscutata erythropus]
ENYDDDSTSSNSETNRIEETASNPSQKQPTKKRSITSFKVRSCLIEVDNRNSPNSKCICGQIIRTQGSTRNFATHLGSRNSARIEQIEKALVPWIIDDFQPFFVAQSSSFNHLLKVLDPYYDSPSDKQIKLRINEGYNLVSARLKEIMKIETVDLDNLNTIFEEEDLVVDYDKISETETTIKGHKVKISNPTD